MGSIVINLFDFISFFLKGRLFSGCHCSVTLSQTFMETCNTERIYIVTK